MKKSVLAFFIAGCIGISLAQTSKNRGEKDYKNYPYWIEMMQDPQANFFETQKAFYTYWKGRKIEKGGGYKPFKRWEHFMAQQVDEKGNKPQPNQILNELQNIETNPINPELTIQSGWQEVGPVQLPTNGTGQPNGLGRVNALGFHPTDANTFYAGAPAGGLWKTTDGGSNWSSSTDALATLGVSSIVVDHTNPSVVYFGSGDRDASDAPGLGVYKSTDGGSTWAQSNSGMGNRTVGELVMDPTDNTVLIAATNGGIYRSTNSGGSWSLSISGNFKDLKLHPTNASIMYATTGGNLYKSTNNGVSFSLSMTGIPSGKSRLVVGVSPDEPNTVYVLAAQGSVYGGLFKSTDSGANFTTQSTTPNIMDYSTNGSGTSGQAWYDMCIAINPTNASEVYVGGVNVFKSTNSGSTWTINAHWVGSGGASAVHADQHILRYSPAGKLYVGNDGGVYHKGTSNESWTDISSGLAISQCYKIGQSQTDVNRVIVGYQDNGTGIYDNGAWRTEIGGDGMESAIDYTNSAYMYGELYYGAIRRSTNNGYSFSNIAGNGVNGITESGAWVTPYVLHETDPNTMFIGYRDIWRSTNVKASSTGSVSWTEISSNLGGSGAFSFLEHNEANGNILFASKGSALFRSDNVMAASVVWTTLSVPGSGSILSIETSELDENIVYLSRGSRIYKSTNKGSSWTDISSNIANSQYKTSLVYAPMSIGRGLYVATDYGVFFKPENETDWISYSQGLPNYAKIKEIELYEDASGNNNHKIRAASYGRGLWSNDIYQTGEVVSVDVTASNVCLGSAATIIASNATSYFWTAPNGSVVGNSATLTISPTQTTIYTVNGIMANGDTTQANSTVNVLNPVVSIAGQNSVCTGTTATLTASVTGVGSFSYLWSNGATTQSISVSPTTNTVYTVTATSTEGCTSTTSHQVSLISSADYLIVEVKTDNYPGETSWTLTGNSGNVYQTFQQGGYTSANTVHTDTIFCVTDSCLVFNMSDTYGDGICCSYGQGYYKIFQSNGTLLASGGAFSSTTSSNFCLQVTTPPVFELTVVDSILTACQGESVTFTANGADNYTWQDQSGSTLSSTNQLTVNAISNTSYTVYGYLNGDTLSKNVSLLVEDVVISMSGTTEACEGETITLTASGASSYLWSTGDTTSTIAVNNFNVPFNSVWVMGQTNGCSSDTLTANLNWITNPVVSITGNTTLCLGDSVTLTANGADTYLWSNGSTGNTLTVSPSSTSVITLQGFALGCSSTVVSETIVVQPNPVVTVTGNTEVCQGDSVFLTATGADTFLWSNGSTGNTITLIPIAASTVTVQGFTNGCSSAVVSESISVLTNPTVSISGNTTVCAGDSITLTASGADNYIWSNGSTGNTLTLNPSASTTVTVQGFTNGCSSTVVSESITVNPTPLVAISGDSEVCLGESITLIATGADTYVWSNGSTGNSITFTPDANTTYTVQGFTAGCASAFISHSIVVNTTTQVVVTGNTQICIGESTTLTASGADTYLWSDGSTGNTFTVNPSASTTVTVQGFTSGCGSDMVTETITVNPLPVVAISGNTTVCARDSLTLTASGADTYVWSDGSTGNTLTINPSASTTVSVQGFTLGCASALASEIITVNTAPIITLTGNTTICTGESITLTVSGADAYLWSDGSTGNTITLSPTASTTVSVQGYTLGCSSEVLSKILIVNENPTVSISGNTSVCSGDSVTLQASGADTYLWSDGSTGNTLTLSPTNTTTVTVQGYTSGCSSDVVSETVLVNNAPTVTLTGNAPICIGESITLTASGADTYIWSNGSTGNTLTVSPTATMAISVQGFTNGCASNPVIETLQINPTPQVTLSGNTMVCPGELVTLIATGADTYLWSDGSTGDTLTVNPTATTTVSVQGFTAGCGSDIVAQSITVNTNPTVTISGNTDLCLGDSITLIASGADTYVWSNGSTGSTITLSPTATTTVSVQGFTAGCGSNMASETILINPTPLVTLSGNAAICTGESITLTASGADAYVWSNGSTGNTITLNPTATTTVSVQGFTNGCSSNMVSETILVNPTPQIAITGNSAICLGESITLTATGADTYIWSDGSTGNTITLSPTATTTVSVQGFSNGCSSDLVTETITVNTNPSVSISGNTDLCSGDSITLTASGADTYLWSDGSTGNTITLSPTVTSTVSVQGFSNGCGSDLAYDTIYINPAPQVTLTGNAAICLGESITLTASGADSYVWSNGSTGNTITLSPTATTTVSVQGFTNGCSSNLMSETILVNPNPQITITGNSAICLGESITLTATGADTYLWSDGSTGNTITLNPTATAIVSVQGFSNGCGSDLVTDTVFINPNPEISVSGNTDICFGESITLTATGADAYLWSDGSTGNTLTVTPDSSTTISVQGFTNGCSSNMISETITVNSINAVQILGDTDVCLGDTVTLSASGNGTYLWSTGETTQSIQVVTTANTTISVTSTQNGCSSTDEVNLMVISSPVVVIDGNLEACAGESITLTASGADSYVWSTGETTESITFTVSDSTTISVTGTTSGCASSTESVEIIANSSSSYFVVEINTDWYGYETTWTLEDELGNTVASHTSADGSYQNNSWYRDTVFCATIGSCYTFTINDSYGDGICCSYGNGQYSIIQSDGTILAQGGNFNYTETQDFCIGEPQTAITVEVSENELEVCKKETFSVTASGANSYVWTKPNGNVVSQNATLTTHVNQTTTFTVTGTTGTMTDTKTVTVVVDPANEVKIIIKTDWYGYETSWALKDGAGNIVASKSANSYKNNKKYKHKVKCLKDECYTLEVYDSYGDGMCCSYGYGYFKVVDGNGVVLANGGQFGYQTSASFCFGGSAVPKLPYEDMDDVITDYVAKTAPNGADLSSLDDIMVYPNPVHGELNIDAESSDFFIDRYVLTDVSGRILMDESFDKPFKTKSINTSSFTQGQYFIKLFTGNQVKVIKVIKE